MSSNKQYSENSRQMLLQLARTSIHHGLNTSKPLLIELNNYAQELQKKRASFVTLEIKGQLRGCIGMLEPVRPLVQDIAENAFAAAFKDPRFPALQQQEFLELEIHISILSLAEPITFSSEQDLLAQIKPGVDGLILEEGIHRGTFLPSVWESLPDPEQFLRHLKVKAGLTNRYWSDTIRISRYSTEVLDDKTDRE
jgi:AmmeMemoRadiSam system protein A